ncbi:MAG TPA: YggT family protein [Opitutaceae bacterium]|nr:YggT family protein [Opitutaceae bacterium]
MRDALIYLVDSLLTIYLYLLVLRFAMQLTRADFRNQIANFVVVVTNPVIMPLRRVLPPLGKVDTASVLAIIVVAAANIALVSLIAGSGVLDPLRFAWVLAFTLVRTFLQFYLGVIVVFAILSWVVPAGYNPAMALLGTIVEPVLRPFRRIIPPIANFDLSVLWASLAIGVLLRLLPQLFGFTIT